MLNAESNLSRFGHHFEVASGRIFGIHTIECVLDLLVLESILSPLLLIISQYLSFSLRSIFVFKNRNITVYLIADMT